LKDPFKQTAVAVITRIANTSPGTQMLGVQDLNPELSNSFPELDHQSRPVFGSKVLEEIYNLCPEVSGSSVYDATTGERLCVLIRPEIWSHTPSQIRL